jgi:diacylglycerol kinase (ATP)
MTQNNIGLGRIVKACGYSMAGLKAAWKSEAAFRQEILLLPFMLPMAFWLGRGLLEELLLIAVCMLVVIVELLNSAIEAVVDRISDEHHVLSGRAKDMGSAAVFVSILLVVFVWGGVAFDHAF